ncbi:MAG: hypothetical protein IT328_16195 [Caldilineaceae bacterium]|nr:hypothetical protein [Caldilineaceae bacterium]
MQYLFNSKGEHIANFVNGRLHAPTGKNIGHYLDKEQIFIDMDGRYLGEIIYNDRLMANVSSPHKSKTFSDYGTHSSAGNLGNPGTHSSIGKVSGYDDIPPSRLKA